MKPAVTRALALLALAACKTSPKATPAEAATPADASADATKPAQRRTGVLPPSIYAATLMPNRHVLFVAGGHSVLDWDPAGVEPPQRIEIGAADHQIDTWLVPGGQRFVVGTREGESALTLALWDAERHTKVADLPGTWKTQQPLGGPSRDGARFVLQSSVNRSMTVTQNDFVVYDLASAGIVHTTKLPPLETERYMIYPRLSWTGRYLAYSHPYFPVVVLESATGKRVLQTPKETGYSFDGVFVGPTHFLHLGTSDADLRLTDLETGKVTHRIDLGAGDKKTSAGRPSLSPDERRAVVVVYRSDHASIVVWNLTDGTSQTFPGPSGVCSPYCAAEWRDATHVVVSAEPKPRAGERLIIDAEAGSTSQVSGAYSYRFGAFEAFEGDGDAGLPYVVTPSGARVEIAGLRDVWQLQHETRGEQLLLWRSDVAVVITSAGDVSELVPSKSSK